MNVLPAQKLSISQFSLGLAAGLMLFLLPNDAKRQLESETLCEAYIFLISLVITAVLFFITKRYESVGVSLITMSSLTAVSFVIEIIIGFSENSSEYWPDLDQYRIIGMFLLWFIPFIFCTIIRLLSGGSNDNNDTRRGYAMFMSISMKALLMIHIVVIIFKLIMPDKPSEESRKIEFMILTRITDCINGTHENGIPYIMWHCIVLAPLSFYLSVLVPKFKLWQITVTAGAVGLASEVMQFVFNTGTACTDDVLMLIIGAVFGFIIKRSIDLLRKIITRGEDPNMLSFEYTHINMKPKGEAQVLTEE